jgi:Ca2+ transporting ATPase
MIVLIILLFFGKSIFGFNYGDNDEFYETINNVVVVNIEKTTHYTIVFHTFVFMQVFNEINSRKLAPYEYNVFHGFFNNFLFLGIIIGTVIVQCLIVEHGSVQTTRTCSIRWEYHCLCIGIGMFSLVQGLIVKAFLPVSWFQRFHMKEEEMTEEQSQQAFVSTFRKSFRQSVTKKVTQLKEGKE